MSMKLVLPITLFLFVSIVLTGCEDSCDLMDDANYHESEMEKDCYSWQGDYEQMDFFEKSLCRWIINDTDNTVECADLIRRRAECILELPKCTPETIDSYEALKKVCNDIGGNDCR